MRRFEGGRGGCIWTGLGEKVGRRMVERGCLGVMGRGEKRGQTGGIAANGGWKRGEWGLFWAIL